MAIIRLVCLYFVILFIVLTISKVLFHQVTSTRVVFVVIPVVVVLVVTIVGSNLNAGALMCGCGHD